MPAPPVSLTALSRTRKSLGSSFSWNSKEALQAWLASAAVEPFWSHFLVHGYPKKPSVGGWLDFETFYHHTYGMNQSECTRPCRLLEYCSTVAKFPLYLDCLAWLLCWLVWTNTEFADGVFYSEKLDLEHRARKMWYVILHLIWSETDLPGSTKTPPTQTAGSAALSSEGGQSAERTLDPSKGEVLVAWNNIPKAVLLSGMNSRPLITGFCGYGTQDAFCKHLSKLFTLKECQHTITCFEVEGEEPDEDCLWNNVLRYVHDNENIVSCTIYTEKVSALPAVLVE